MNELDLPEKSTKYTIEHFEWTGLLMALDDVCLVYALESGLYWLEIFQTKEALYENETIVSCNNNKKLTILIIVKCIKNDQLRFFKVLIDKRIY